MIRLSFSLLFLAALATVYSTDYFVEKFEGNVDLFVDERHRECSFLLARQMKATANDGCSPQPNRT